MRRPGQHGGGVPQQQAEYPPVATSGLEKAGYGEHAAVIKTETAQQDQYLDQIAMGLEQLKHGAMAMNVRGDWVLVGAVGVGLARVFQTLGPRLLMDPLIMICLAD